MRKVHPEETDRLMSYKLYIDAPMPMVTVFQTLDVTKLVKLTHQGYKFNMLMCYCIGCAAQQIHEFYLLPIGRELVAYDALGINVIVNNKDDGINTCDLPFTEDLREFSHNYNELTEQVKTTCENYEISERMIIGTSCLAKYKIDGIVNMYSGIFNNPFLLWGRYESVWLRKKLRVSFQFHHVQMDGQAACQFLALLQKKIDQF